jgi:hypothetical protein
MGMFGGGESGPTELGAAGGNAGMQAEAGAGSSGGFWAGIGSWISGLFSSGAATAMADGGIINEQIVGKGLQSGTTYTFGERTPYGENEMVAPIDQLTNKFQSGGLGMAMQVHMPINIQAIDTQTGVDFLMKNNAVLEANMINAIRSNKRIRDAIRGSR